MWKKIKIIMTFGDDDDNRLQVQKQEIENEQVIDEVFSCKQYFNKVYVISRTNLNILIQLCSKTRTSKMTDGI